VIGNSKTMTEPPRMHAGPAALASGRRTADLRLLLSSPQTFIALGFGAGLSPWAPGTVGSLVAFPLSWALDGMPFVVELAAWIVLTLLGIWMCDQAGKDLGEPDHGAIVWDEICGMGLVLLAVPDGFGWAVLAFLLFRLFDILKPWPANIIDRTIPNGLGTMGDDVLAAVYAIAVLAVVQALLPTDILN
jgi:phosphatidylglycerophosphatase A